MDKGWIITVAASVILIVLYWIFYGDTTLTGLEEAYLQLPIEQTITERNWRDIHFEFKAENSGEMELFNPLAVEKSRDGYYYVVDWGDMRVKKFDDEAALVDVYVEGQGEGPGEAVNFIYMNVDDKNRLWTVDSGNKRVTMFQSPDNWEIYSMKEDASRFLYLSNNKYFFKGSLSSTPEIRDLESQTTEVLFDSLVDDPQLWSYVLGMMIAKDPEGGFIRVNTYTNDFVRYTDEGKIVYFRRPVEPLAMSDLPVMTPREYYEGQSVFFNEVDPRHLLQRSYSVQVVDNQIHLLTSEIRDDTRVTDIVDVYQKNDGDYLYSYRLPEPVYPSFSVDRNHIAAITGESPKLTIWEVTEEW